MQNSKSAKVVPIVTGAVPRPVVSLARLPAAVHRVREKTAQILQLAFKNLFEGADDALFDLADKATSNQDQNLYFEAMREVRLQRRDIERDFFLALDKAYAVLLSSSLREDDDASLDVSLDDLALLGNDQLEYQVAIDGMVAKALEKVAEPCQHIALRIDSLVPRKVYQQNNPLGPAILCKSYWSVIEPLDVDIKAKLILLKLFDKAVISQLDKIYTVINNLLIQQNILPSLTIKSQHRSRGRSIYQVSSATAGSARSPAARGQEPETQMLSQLRQLLGAHQGGAHGAALPSETLLQGGQVLDTTQLTQALTSVQQAVPGGSVSHSQALLDSAQILGLIQRQGLPEANLSSVDKDVIHLINMLFEFILDDRNLPAPMKALLVRLQIPLLKVAVEDKNFFNVSGHPARRLLNELAVAALGWQAPAEGEPDDPLYRKIAATVTTVLAEFESDVAVFETLLTDFIAFVEKERRRAGVLEKRTLDAEDGKARADQARARVTEQLAASTLGRALPECVTEILEGPWHNYMFLLLLKFGEQSEQWLAACDTVDDLIWSVTAEMDTDGRGRLMSLLSDLLGQLREGFETIAYNSFATGRMLKSLEREHLARLRQEDVPRPVAEDAEKRALTPEQRAAASSKAAGTAAADRDAVVLAPVASGQGGVASAGASAGDSAAEAAEIESAAVAENRQHVAESWLEHVDRLTQGSWFEAAEPGKAPYRCRLAAIIRSVDRFIFVNRNGMKVTEKSRADLAWALQEGRFRLLDEGMLFDRALESVIGNLRASRNRPR
ncbi:DUF1631 domain-containing protein [Pseudomaricurvus alcaniphilus]|uniref:DUF1631 domain-containing protein n=1 Tax=Pseudomaricurvus alcaniphilus TaxID=1166482 RepID=UPI00140A85C8|nr:DUF1631 domain-containing protein [Pseudomaricurvus alcaniphilus]NHN38093.1 DUF1631 domain-containing protein [Pseudomaricurvus alcaniphilus]